LSYFVKIGTEPESETLTVFLFSYPYCKDIK
jgi:hypothetical protein